MSRRILPLRGLQALEAAARHLSFARAAEELHVTPAAISQHIKQLEEHLGYPLFKRESGLQLSDAAQGVLHQLGSAFDGLERASTQLRVAQTNRPLVVSLPPTFASRWLIPRLERFQTQHPEIDLRLLASTRVVDFDVEDVDMAVRYGHGRYPGLHVERLRQENMLVVANPRVAANLREPTDLCNSVLLHYTTATDPIFPDWPTWLRSAGVTVTTPLRIQEFGDINLVIEGALAGLGAGMVWQSLVEEQITQGRLIRLFPEQPLSNAYHFVCPPQRLNLPGVTVFRDWLLSEIRSI
ncbi:MAG TPA: LysR substrate-binding domain-containing protein [Rhodocyclaceae bacterium]|nr:LysR substrate-binding domain-containing protein [Rhodocyclaceae bacterium]